MGRAKNVLYTVAAGVAVGMLAGVLFAPAKGKDTRDRLRELKRKLTGSHKDIDDNREALEELSDLLKEEQVLVNKKIEKLK